jgi:predicted dehydrogenase
MAPNSFKAGIIGYGTSAKVFHIPFLTASPSFTVHAIVQRTGDAAKEAHPESIIYRSTDELFADKDVDFVVVCTPVETHFDMATRALNAGKHGMSPYRHSARMRKELIMGNNSGC